MATRMGTVRALMACLVLLLALPALAQQRRDGRAAEAPGRHQVSKTIQVLRQMTGRDLRLAGRGEHARIDKPASPRLMSTGGGIAGTVTYEVPGDRAEVYVIPVDSTSQDFFTVSPAENGTYTVMDLPAADYYVIAAGALHIPEFYDNATSLDDATPVTVRDGQVSQNIDFSLALPPTGDGVISGRITDATSGEAIEGAYVFAFDVANPFFSGWSPVASDGTYSIESLPDGNYYVQAEGPGYMLEWYDGVATFDLATAVTIQNDATVTGINFALDRGGMITGRVLDQNGDPVADVIVQAIPSGVRDNDSTFDDGTFGVAQTDGNGDYVISGLRTDDYLVGAIWSGMWTSSEQWYNGKATAELADEVSVTFGSTTTGINFELNVVTADGVITGVVTDTSGTPIPGAMVMVQTPFDGTNYPISATGFTDSTGRYTIEGLPDAEYYGMAYLGGWTWVERWWPNAATPDDAVLIPLVNGATTPANIDFELPILTGTASITGRVLLSDGSVAQYAQVDAVVFNPTDSTMWFGASAVASADGTYLIPGMPAGTYLLHASVYTDNAWGEMWYDGATDPTDADPIVLSDGQELTEVNFNVSATPFFGAVKGTITSASTGAPINHAYVELAYEGGYDKGFGMDMQLHALTGIDGTYEIPMAPVGQYVVVAVIPGGVAYSGNTTDYDAAERITVLGGDTVVADIAITTRSAGQGSISGMVTDEAGAAVDPAVMLALPATMDETFYPGLTDTDGSYIIPGLPDGRYYVMAYSPSHIQEFYRDAFDPSDAELVVISGGASVTGINFGLETMRCLPENDSIPVPGTAPGVYGTVVDAAGQPVRDATVYLMDGSKNALASVRTHADGSYEIANVTPGTEYRMMASSMGYEATYNNDASSFESAQPVRITNGRTRVDFELDTRVLSVDDDRSGVVTTTAVPNPFTSETSISYALDRASNVTITVVDAQGTLVRELHAGAVSAGRHQVRWDGRTADGTTTGTGVFFVRIQTATGIRTLPVTLVR